MAHRITWTFLTLIAAFLVLAVVPLGLSMAGNERASFQFATESSARLVASAAEERLGDQGPASPMTRAISAAAAQGDCVTVYGQTGVPVAATACRVTTGPAERALAAQVGAGDSRLATQGQWLIVAVPVGDTAEKFGAVVFARSADPLHDRINAMWGWLSLAGAVMMAAGAALSVWIARWVSRPLSAVGRAASLIGEGALDARAPTGQGPAEVRALAGTLNRMAARTESLVHSHRNWVADVSHQLRTPLTALRLRLDLLVEDASPAAATEIAGVREEVSRLTRLVDGLLAVARAESAVPRPGPVRVDETVTERVAAWEPVARERGISLTAAAPGAVSAHLGEGDLEQILDNVIANALEAVADGGTVRIESSGRQSRVAVRVVDNGPGMAAEAKRAAFHRFTRRGAGGNGLGLAIVSRLASANGGGIELADTPGGGLTIVLDLPAAHQSLPVLNRF